jgi:hypothetical protein
MNYIIYDIASGRINSRGSVPDEEHYQIIIHSEQQRVTSDRIDSDENWYYLEDVLTERPELPASWNKTTIKANGIDEAILSELPNPTSVGIRLLNKVGVNPVQEEITDGSLTITAEFPGEYLVEIDLFPYKFYSKVVTVA